MVREVDLVSYLPLFLQQYQEPNSTLTAENPEYTIVWNAADRVFKNEFIATADEYGISRYEEMLDILPFEEDTLESRRSRVQARWFTAIPYTMVTLLMKLTTLCGDNNFIVKKKFATYQIYLETDLELFGQVEELERALLTMMPCNLVCNVQNKILCLASGMIFTAGGVCNADEFFITNDEQYSKDIHHNLNVGTGVVGTVFMSLVDDFQTGKGR